MKDDKKKFPLKLAIIGAVILLIAGAAFILLSSPSVSEYKDEISVAERSQNTNLAAALLSGGINDSLVDVTSERVYVGYGLPSGFDQDTTQRFVIGAAADASPESAKIVALQYLDGTPIIIWTVLMSDFKDYVNGVLTLEEFESRIQKKTY